MTPSWLQARAKNCRGRWLVVMGFGAQAPNEGRDALALMTQSRLLWRDCQSDFQTPTLHRFMRSECRNVAARSRQSINTAQADIVGLS